MWEVVLIFMLFLTFLTPFRDCRHYSRCSRGALRALQRSLPTSDGRTASPAALSLGAAWRNAFLLAERAKAVRHQAQCFRGRLLCVMHNSWPLWTFQLRPLSLMGNPNGDLFIKTISWLFVVPASHKGGTSPPNIITSLFGLTLPRFDFFIVLLCPRLYSPPCL